MGAFTGMGMIEGLNVLVTTMKGLRAATSLMERAEAISQLTDAQKLVLNLHGQAMELQQRLQALEQENQDLKAKMALQQEVVFASGVYWRKLQDGQLDGPFDPVPWDREKRLERLRLYRYIVDDGIVYWSCQDKVNTREYPTEIAHLRAKGLVMMPDIERFVARGTETAEKIHGQRKRNRR